jgi:hypothetical protein
MFVFHVFVLRFLQSKTQHIKAGACVQAARQQLLISRSGARMAWRKVRFGLHSGTLLLQTLPE